MAEEEKEVPSYKVPPDRKPSYLNSSLLVGLGAGAITGFAFAPFLGAAIGAFIGKKKMESEEDGKEVGPPSMWNKGTFLGAALVIGMFAMGGPAIGGLLGTAILSAASAWLCGKITYNIKEKEYASAREYAYFNGDYSPPEKSEPSLESNATQVPQQTIVAPEQTPAKAPATILPAKISPLHSPATQSHVMRVGASSTSEMSMVERLAAQRTQSLSQRR